MMIVSILTKKEWTKQAPFDPIIIVSIPLKKERITRNVWRRPSDQILSNQILKGTNMKIERPKTNMIQNFAILKEK